MANQRPMPGALLAMLIVTGVPAAADRQAAQPKRAPEMIEIDGARNPELIPQWSAWGFAFRVIATGSRQLPSSVYFAVSREEETMIMKEADQLQKIDRDCVSRVVKLHDLVGKTRNDVLDGKLRDLTLECRWAALHTRDRVLDALAPEGASALMAFVESTKAGTTVSIPKKDLARYLEPQ
jgi:hypothetical protein